MATRPLLLSFLLGALCAHLLSTFLNRAPPPPTRRRTQPPFHMSSLPETGVSHNPEIRKRVLAGYFHMPHITQIAKAELRPRQVASENWHKDMSEMFIFVRGTGVLQLDDRNYTVGEGSVALVFPPTRHTIYNSGEAGTLELFTVAAVP